ncbi:MAG: ABC transporter transmembrane domain-containing protein [Streptosporangiaceae bacterium]
MRQLPVPDPGRPDLRSAWRFIWWLMASQRSSVLAGVLWGCCWMIAQALVPAVIGAAVDALAGRNSGAFTADCLIMLGLGAATAITGVLRHRRVVANFLDAAFRIIQLITAHAATLGSTLPRRLSTGEVISVGSADVESVGGAIDMTGRGSGAIAALIVVAAMLLTRSLPLGLIVLIGGPVLTALTGGLLRPLHRRQQAYRELQGQLANRATDIVSGLRVLRGIGGEAAFSARYRGQSQELRSTGVHVARTESYLVSAEILLPGLFVTAATWIAAHYALHGAITPGQLVSFYAYTSFLALPLATLTEAADKMVRGHVGAGRVIAILRLRPNVTSDGPGPRPEPGGELHDPVTGLTAAAGEFLAVAGDPADGQQLAARIGRYDGAVTRTGTGPSLGGVPLTDLDAATLRERILVAANDAHLFAGRLDEQLAGAGPADASAVRAAVAAASAQDVVEEIPGGLAGQLAARGRTLSGGQAQRLRLARALLADPEVLVLVEPTSAVDAHTEARIAAGLREARSGRTTVVITNSPLLLNRAERVLFLRSGRVAAQGTHAELIAADDAYASAVTRGEP